MTQLHIDNPKYDAGNGVHRVPLWRIGAFALNNTATNLYLFFMMYVAYYLTGFVGLGVVLAGSFSMIMRIWDGVTDPFIGYLVDKTNSKFGKNRPFMLIGNVVLALTSFVMFFVTHHLPEAIRIPFFFVLAAIYYIGYTFQTVVTKSAQTCLTNDPKQRPLFAVFDGIYNTALFAGAAALVANYLVPKYGKVADTGLFQEFWLYTALLAGVFTVLAIIAIAPKDHEKYFGTGHAVKVGFKDYWEVIKSNRAIQMLIASASTDKLGATARTSTVTLVLFGIIAGNYALYGAFSVYTGIINAVFILIFIGIVGGRLGQKASMLIGSWGAAIGNALLIALWVFGDPTTFGLPGFEGFAGWTFFTVALLFLTMVTGGLQAVSGNIVIPMTADCADYEVYRSGKYVPGLMGTLFSAVDKIISSLAPMIAGVLFAAIGFKDKMPDVDTPASRELLYVGVTLAYGLILIGSLVNVVAMKFYPLTKQKMAEIQDKIAEIKAKSGYAA